MNYNLSGKTAIVTGASNGVGLSIAQLLCSAGANVVLADKNEVPLNEETELLKEKGFNVIAFAGDLTKKLTFGQMREEEKFKIDHRSQAFQKIKKFF